MDKMELLAKLKELKIKEINDPGTSDCIHGKADDLLIQYINDEQIKVAFEDLKKWYG